MIMDHGDGARVVMVPVPVVMVPAKVVLVPVLMVPVVMMCQWWWCQC